MTTLKSIVAAVAISAGLVASNLTVFAASASADRYRPYGFSQHRPAPPHHFQPYRQHGPAPQHHRRDRTGDAVGAAVLGIGALIIGAAIADSARRERSQRRYERYED